MAVPRNRTSNARKNSRRSHHAKTRINVQDCTNCGVHVLPHHVCAACGYYAGRNVLVSEASCSSSNT